jgi:hypothetical protein
MASERSYSWFQLYDRLGVRNPQLETTPSHDAGSRGAEHAAGGALAVPGTQRVNLILLELPPALGARLGVRDPRWARFCPL